MLYLNSYAAAGKGAMASALVLVLLGGCMSGPNFTPPATTTDTAYTKASLSQLSGDSASSELKLETSLPMPAQWWTLLGSPRLDSLIHAALEVFGLAGRWRRPPYVSAGDADIEKLRGFFRDVGLL